MDENIKEVELIEFNDYHDFGKFKITLKNNEDYIKKCPRGYYKKSTDGTTEYFVQNKEFFYLLNKSTNVKK